MVVIHHLRPPNERSASAQIEKNKNFSYWQKCNHTKMGIDKSAAFSATLFLKLWLLKGSYSLRLYHLSWSYSQFQLRMTIYLKTDNDLSITWMHSGILTFAEVILRKIDRKLSFHL